MHMATIPARRPRWSVRPLRSAPSSLLVLGALSTAVLGCSKSDRRQSASEAASDSASASTSSAAPSGVTTVRGSVTSVTDSVLTVSAPGGNVRVTLAPPLQVYETVRADPAQVKENTFVGVTSVKQPDGSERATEIHIFPEPLRGTAEGSFLMEQTGGGPRSTMTNGTVTPPRMTNGTISAQKGGALTVRYHDETRSIMVPPGVPVTAIAPTQTKVTTGAKVVVLARKQADGTLRASSVLLADTARSGR